MENNPNGLFKTLFPEGIRQWLKPPITLKVNPSGWYFILFTLAVGFSAVNTGNNLLYLILGAMLSFIVASGILSNIVLKRLEIKRDITGRPFAKTPTLYRFLVKNKKRFIPSYLILVYEDAIDNTKTFFPMIGPGDTASGIVEIVFPRRGINELGKLKVSTDFPFGIFSKGMNRIINQEILVLPRVREINLDNYELRGWEGDTPLNRSGYGSEPWGVKDFLFGDNPRHIHWKSSARREKLMTKEFARESERKVTIKLSPDPSVDGDELEERVETAASISARLTLDGYSVGLELPGIVIEPDKGRHQLDTILEALALFDNRVVPTPTVLDESRMGLVIDV